MYKIKLLLLLQIKASNYHGVGKQSVTRMDLNCNKSEEKTTPTTGSSKSSSITSNSIYQVTIFKVSTAIPIIRSLYSLFINHWLYTQ